MSGIAHKMARLRRWRNAALVVVAIPAALLAGCAQQPAPPPPPPPAPMPMAYPAPPQPMPMAPAPVPAVRG